MFDVNKEHGLTRYELIVYFASWNSFTPPFYKTINDKGMR